MFRPAPRSWLLLAVPVLALVVLVAWQAYRPAASEPRAYSRLDLPSEPLKDIPVPGPGSPTAQLSRCGVDDWPRPAARGEGEQARDPQLVFGGWDSNAPGADQPGRPRFTVHLALRPERLPLLLTAPLAVGNVTLDIFGPHGEGRRASARGLSATVVDESLAGKPVKAPKSGTFRVEPGANLLLDVDLPPAAVCPGYSVIDAGRCLPETTNDAADCPVLTLTLTDPAVRAYRAVRTGKPPAGLSDRLVAVSDEPDVTKV
ncbi:hypothetical protein F0344_15145 [Streptomyces finlayi]|uniref:Uncharacterized protein n=1 Tax=Streptomyces finlayi TaxID=67296 RepID=A0A7G7BKC1_9ACTN|nr:hypothetical protein [Streptomyces finlayi]QNE75786.1 hypothetical protein F0344_15145 [Streptomyces finlayi]